MARSALRRTRDSAVRSNPLAFDYPGFIPFCLATDVGGPPRGEGWAHEIKYDGFRSQLHLRDGRATVFSKSGYRP